MKRHSLYSIVLWVFLIPLLVSAAMIYFSISQRQADLFRLAISEKLRLAETIKETVASPAWLYRLSLLPGLEKAFISGLARFNDIRFIRIVSGDGQILQSTIDGEENKKIKDRDILEAIPRGKPIIRDESFRGEEIKSVIQPGYENRVIWIGFSFQEIESLAERFLWRDIIIIVVALLLIILVPVFIIRSIIRPIREITERCEDIRQGRLDIKVQTSADNEIGELAATFNKMIKDLKSSREDLEESKKVLEVRVIARTKELESLAGSLENEVKERTSDLQEKMIELEKFNHLAVDRELKMIELKKEINKLKSK